MKSCGWGLHGGISSLWEEEEEETPFSSPCDHTQPEATVCEPGREQHSMTLHPEYISVSKPPSIWYFVMASPADITVL